MKVTRNPLIYVFNLQSFIGQFGSKKNARAALDSLRQAAKAAGLSNPYMVGLTFDPVADAPTIRSLGLDAVSSYSAIQTQGGSHQLAYQRLARANRSFWSRALSTGLKVVAPLSTGWDPRPVGAPRNRNTPYYAQAKPEEIAAHLKSALQWTSAHAKARDANTVLVYAWNEIAEGGWLTPMLDPGQGNARLDAIGRVLNNRAGR